MKRHGLVLAFAASLLAAACATSALYRAASSEGSTGYTERRLEENRYRVTFTGGEGTPAGVVQDYALLRAGELTLNLGYEWFYVVARDTVQQDDPYRRSGYYSAGRYCGLYGCTNGLYGGIMVGDFGDSDRLAASLDIVMGKGPKPQGNPSVYDAQDLVNTIRAGGVR